MTMAAEVSWRECARASGSTVVLTGASTVLMGTLPLLNGLFADRLQLDWHQLGWLGTALLGALAGDRFGFVPILFLGTLAAIGGEVTMAGASTASAYFMGQLAFNFGWVLGVSYYLAGLAKRAHDVKLIRSAPIALVIAGVLGPLSVALLESVSNTAGLLTFTAMLSLIALIPATIRRS